MLTRSRHFVRRGLVEARTGWTAATGDLLSSFEARRAPVGHWQFDEGSFTLYGLGGHWAIDPGYSCAACGSSGPAGSPLAPTHASHATGHNVVVIDDSKFTQHGSSLGFTGTTIDGFLDAPGFSWAHADLRYAVFLTNRQLDAPLRVTVTGLPPGVSGRLRVLTAASPWSRNSVADPGALRFRDQPATADTRGVSVVDIPPHTAGALQLGGGTR